MNNATCLQTYKHHNDSWCPTYFDNWLCWPPTPPDENATLNCPLVKGVRDGGQAYRYCMDDGTWEDHNKTNNPGGYTHYDDCIMPQLRDLAKMCNDFGPTQCIQIAKITRYLEIVGLSFSLISLIISLHIFFQYRILKNNRTRIHRNLFIATLLQVLFRLIKYVDQGFKDNERLIENTPYINESGIVLLEYTKTAMFVWMFIEGLYLHNMVTVTVFQEYTHIKLYCYVGWILPAMMTALWAVIMTVEKTTWDFYYFLPYYWILEGPRSTIILVNLIFLLNIIRVLIVKLRESQTSEIEQARKAVRAAIFLLPLMGIANIFFWLDYRFAVAWKFALWSYTSYFVNTFQGFFVAVLYCFLNGEVQTAIKTNFYRRMSLRNQDYAPCRQFTLISTAGPDLEPGVSNKDERLTSGMRKYFKPFKSRLPKRMDKKENDETWPSHIPKDKSDTSLIEERNFETKV